MDVLLILTRIIKMEQLCKRTFADQWFFFPIYKDAFFLSKLKFQQMVPLKINLRSYSEMCSLQKPKTNKDVYISYKNWLVVSLE